jgi:hypothetical protein
LIGFLLDWRRLRFLDVHALNPPKVDGLLALPHSNLVHFQLNQLVLHRLQYLADPFVVVVEYPH